jgi:hypothetical protein
MAEPAVTRIKAQRLDQWLRAVCDELMVLIEFPAKMDFRVRTN